MRIKGKNLKIAVAVALALLLTFAPWGMMFDDFADASYLRKHQSNRTVTVGVSGNVDFTGFIQPAIDSISDASFSKRYTVQVYPGVYVENIIGKNYVSLVGVGDIEDVLVRGTSGSLYTAPDEFSTVYNMAWLMEPAASGSVIFDLTAVAEGGQHYSDRTVSRMQSDVDGITGKILDANAGTVGLYRSDAYYTMGGSAAGSNTHRIIETGGSAGIIMSDINAIVTVGDVDDDYELVHDGGSGRSVYSRNLLFVMHTDAASSGKVTGIRHAAAGPQKTSTLNTVFMVGSGSGTGTGMEVDSDGGTALVDSTHNKYNVQGFGTNRQFECAAGDTLNSSNDYQSAADGSSGSGTINFINTQVFGVTNISSGGEFTIDDADEWHAFDTLAVGEASANMDVQAGSNAAITAFADVGGGQVTVTSAGHGLLDGDNMTITGTTNYNGVYGITNVTTDTFEITATWVADDATGTWRHGSHMITNQKGSYQITWAFSASAAGANKKFEFASFKNTGEIDGTNIPRHFSTANDVGPVAGVAGINLNPGDHLWFAVRNVTDSTNITISDGSIVVTKIN